MIAMALFLYLAGVVAGDGQRPRIVFVAGDHEYSS